MPTISLTLQFTSVDTARPLDPLILYLVVKEQLFRWASRFSPTYAALNEDPLFGCQSLVGWAVPTNSLTFLLMSCRARLFKSRRIRYTVTDES